ncbi:MAG: site-specific integrase [Chloroflexi bacterium]|nr:site-specific integrase [Chloroflexota bacterium]
MSESTAKVKRGRRLRGEGSVFKRSSDGRWVGKLTHPRTGKRVVVYGWTAAEARARLDQTKEKIRKRQPVAPERQTVGQFLDQWLASVRPSAPGQTPGYRTYESYAQLVRLHLCPGLGHIKLRQLDAESVQEFINAKLESGLSPRTVQYILAILRMALARAEAWKRVDENVARPLLVKAPSVRRSQVQPFDAEEARAFLTASSGHRLEALFITAICTGLRQGELFGLRWEDVDLEAGCLHVRHALSWSHRTGGRAWELIEPKTDRSRRSLDLPAVARTALQEHRVRQWEERIHAGPLWEEHGFVFCTWAGKPLDGPNVTHALHRLLDQAGLRQQRFHDLRHAAASLLLAQGLQLREIMELLGHSQIALTANLYTHLMPAMKKEAATRMDAALSL